VYSGHSRPPDVCDLTRSLLVVAAV